ncbi:hypothetical protein RvY_02345 [Ramazzottius varieornatus]|uniref:Uncharacterized protein n=1 Tax=Ramazzottius varieornatus TaxID=947166 RepID=A0A1D1UTY7_RAMVA|nr:hypothetical protein RvY_02345 [Ramazzottius varieornatus]
MADIYLRMGIGQRGVIFTFGINDIVERFNHPANSRKTDSEWDGMLDFMLRPFHDFLVSHRHLSRSLFATDFFGVNENYSRIRFAWKAR